MRARASPPSAAAPRRGLGTDGDAPPRRLAPGARSFGLSNFTAWETVYIFEYMKARGWVTPSVYQGMLNGITRSVVTELLPALRRLGMGFYAVRRARRGPPGACAAGLLTRRSPPVFLPRVPFRQYNPLAGGMLTGKYKRVEDGMVAGRFTGLGDEKYGETYRNRFMLPEHFEAVELISAACAAEAIEPADASLRWLMHHSGLAAELGDGVIVGASSLGHFDANMASLRGDPLPAAVVDAFDRGWDICRPVVAGYARGVSGSNL